jgi:hypothetical protein
MSSGWEVIANNISTPKFSHLVVSWSINAKRVVRRCILVEAQ